MSDGRTNHTRNEARAAWQDARFAFSDLTVAKLERLRELIDAEMRSGEYLRGTLRAKIKPKLLRSGGYDIRCEAWYFSGRNARQCVTFEPSGFVGFAGWSDDTDLQPILRGFLAWLNEMRTAPTAGEGG